MPTTGRRAAFELLWDDTNNSWAQANATYLTGQGLHTIQVDRTCDRGTVRSDTCRVIAEDRNWWVTPGKVSSSLYPHVVVGTRARLLLESRTSPGTWYPWFFGFVTALEPAPDKTLPASVQITVESPLGQLAAQTVNVTAMDNPLIYDPSGGDSALKALLQAVGLWGTSYVQLDAVGATPYTGTFGGDNTNVGQALAQLCLQSGASLALEPQYALSTSDPDFKLHWLLPLPTDTLTGQWNAQSPHNELETMPRVEWNGEAP